MKHVPTGRVGEYRSRQMWDGYECAGYERAVAYVRFDGSGRNEQVVYADLEAMSDE